MKQLFWNYIANTYDRHCLTGHGGDYEVCPRLRCRLAYWVERTLGHWLYPEVY
jgi:hypothetical protein